MIKHWVTLFTGKESGPEGFGRAVQWLVEFFYVDNGILDSSELVCLQAALDVLMGLFNMVGLCTNVNNMVGMLCHTCITAGVKSEAAYTWWLMRVGTSF